jgi:hypothetical protein
MPKKCIPGVICLENMTLAVFFFLFVVLAYLYYTFLVKVNNKVMVIQPSQMMSPMIQSTQMIQPIGTPNIIMDPYAPPLRTDDSYFAARVNDGIQRGIPVNIETRGLSASYTQMGILTRMDNREMILPLMGRRLMTGLDKWQYYTISNTGAINTKLPISIRGRSCSGEYGCDCIMNGDTVYVEGYQDTFKVTLYDTAKFQYIPL